MNKKSVVVASGAILLTSVTVLAGTITDIPKQIMLQSDVQTTLDTQIKNVNLGAEMIGNPEKAESDTDTWSNKKGNYIYFGNYYQSNNSDKEAVKWKVLSNASSSNDDGDKDSILLVSDCVLDRVLFNESKDDGSAYNSSNLKKWLNSEEYTESTEYGYTTGGFYNTAFSNMEKGIIATSTISDIGKVGILGSCDVEQQKVYILSASEADNADYGFYHTGKIEQNNNSTKVKVTKYAKDKGVYQKDDFGYWWLRSNDTGYSGFEGVVDYGGWLTSNTVEDENNGVCPAINIKKDEIAFVTAANAEKSASFSSTANGSEIKEWKLTAKGGDDFKATLTSSESVKASQSVSVNVTSIGTSKEGVTYNRISAMLIDNNNTVIAYGKVSNSAEVSKISIAIPKDVKTGDYKLCVFAEDVNSTDKLNLVDYSSNIEKITLKVSGDPDVSNPTTKAEQPTTKKENPTQKKDTTFAVKGSKYKVVKGSTTEVSFASTSNKKIKKVVIPATVKSSVTGKTYKVTSITSKAFNKYKNLTKVTIGKNVKKIDSKAFYGCKKLKSILIKGKSLKSVGKNAIKGISKKAVIKCPKSKVKAYKKLFKAKTGYKKSIKIKK